jgi:Uma2 family endonuclease
MSVVTNRPFTDRVILQNVSWDTYERLLKDLENSSSPRLAFDQGVLEIMSPHLEHERTNQTLATIVEIVLDELGVDFENAGSTTFKRETLKRGFEPDSCFYIQNVDRIQNKKKIDMEIDPPPDLLIEVDLTSDSLDKFPLYAALGVPEVWRYKDSLEIWLLKEGRYARHQSSAAVPILNEKLVSDLVGAKRNLKRPAWLRNTRKRIRALLP